ncbi:MAG: hypothetical protein L0216_14140 [Planctomycetales bacterium]|nr:hypothetical protein [Planctomycetales bacterium]
MRRGPAHGAASVPVALAMLVGASSPALGAPPPGDRSPARPALEVAASPTLRWLEGRLLKDSEGARNGDVRLDDLGLDRPGASFALRGRAWLSGSFGIAADYGQAASRGSATPSRPFGFDNGRFAAGSRTRTDLDLVHASLSALFGVAREGGWTVEGSAGARYVGLRTEIVQSAPTTGPTRALETTDAFFLAFGLEARSLAWARGPGALEVGGLVEYGRLAFGAGGERRDDQSLRLRAEVTVTIGLRERAVAAGPVAARLSLGYEYTAFEPRRWGSGGRERAQVAAHGPVLAVGVSF